MDGEFKPEEHFDDDVDVSVAEMARAKIMGKRYGRKALKVVHLLGKSTGFDAGKYEDDNIIVEETPGAEYYDGHDISSVRVWAKKKTENGEEADPELVLEYGPDRVGFLRSIGRFNQGAWTEQMDSLNERLKKAQEARKLQNAINKSEPFLPVDYEGDRILSDAEIAEAKLKGKKYTRMAENISNYLGGDERDYRICKRDGVIVGYDYGDDNTPGYSWIEQRLEDGDDDDDNDEYETVYSSRLWFTKKVTCNRPGAWEETVQRLNEEAQAKIEQIQASRKQDERDRFRPQE